MKQPHCQLFLIRHGDTEWSLDDRHTGLTDIPLAEEGREQALLLAEKIKEYSFERVLVSPLKRALETCEIAGLLEGAEKNANLVEWNYGRYEGLTSEEIYHQDPTWNLFMRGAPNGESSNDVSARVANLFANIENAKGNVALFSSAHFMRVLAARWLQLPPTEGKLFRLSPASVSILGYERQMPVILLWNDTSHLKAAPF